MKYFVGWLITVVLVLCLYLNRDLNRMQARIDESIRMVDSLQRQNDSLNSELFTTAINLNRFEVAYEIFSKRNPKAAHQFGTIISEETE